MKETDPEGLPSNTGQIRIILIEDDPELRQTLAEEIQKSPALTLVADYGSAEDALQEAGRLLPQVAVVDIGLPGMSGIAFTAALKQAVPACEILILTAFEDADQVLKALKAGASGYLIKSSSIGELLQGIQDVWAGGAPMSASIARKVVASFHETSQTREILTAREEEVLGYLAKGYPTKEISGLVGVSNATVRFHLRNIYAKLHVNNRTQAILKYLG